MNVTSNSHLNDGKPITLTVAEGLSVSVYKNDTCEWLMSTTDVALGYGVKRQTIASHKMIHSDELKEGIHFVKGVEIFDTLRIKNKQPHELLWTKAGVIRLGFFIKSERAKMFRDWAESVILSFTAPAVNLPAPRRRQHNRLSKERLVEILALVAQIDDNTLRKELVKKLVPDNNVPSVQLELPISSSK